MLTHSMIQTPGFQTKRPMLLCAAMLGLTNLRRMKNEISVPTSAPKIIHDIGERPLVLYSDVRAPLATLSFLRRSLAFAELAMIAYNDEAEAQRAACAI